MAPPPRHEPLQSGFFKDLFAALRPGRTSTRSTTELLDDHEEALRRLFPDGSPSGDGSEQFDRHVEDRNDEVRWQLAHRRRILNVALLAAIVWLAVGFAVAWERFAA